jgi:hypothetical protein
MPYSYLHQLGYTNIFIDDNKLIYLGRLAFLLISTYYTKLFSTNFPPWASLKSCSGQNRLSLEMKSKKGLVSRESGEEDLSATGLLLRTHSAGPVSQTCYDL